MKVDEHRLERLFLNNADFDELSTKMDVFCPFDAVGMDNQEIRHGYFLRYILDPARPHGFGTECLRGFMWAAAEAMQDDPTGSLRALDVHLMNLDDAVVTREYKSIDLLIEIPQAKVIVAVELKIGATEHSGQLGRYRQIVQQEYPVAEKWRQLLLFATKRGDAPSKKDGEGWRALPLKKLVDAFERVIDKGAGHSGARMMLAAYVAMLRRRHLSDQRMEDLARKLWREHGEALEFLMSRKPDILSEVYQRLSDERLAIAERLSKHIGADVEADHSTKTELRFAFKSWDRVPGMLEGTGWKPSKRLMLLHLRHDVKSSTSRVQFYLGPGPQLRRQAIFDALLNHGAAIAGKWGIQNNWRQLTFVDIPAPLDEESSDDYHAKLINELEQFVMTNLPSYDAAMSSLASA
ncbi:MAG: PD-(D/E)XK nuclease family protein [Sphingomonadaceae bacterium]|nr:PD-(D/E)XK nuclease family protein [Sphingomonadaceae bacterium]